VKYFVETVSVAMIHIPSFVKIGSGVQKLLGGKQRLAERMEIAKPALGK
jgi:hypothetical protein